MGRCNNRELHRCIYCGEVLFQILCLDGISRWVRFRDGKLSCQAWRPSQ